MREMKDSGIEWIGQIPKHWEVHPVYAYFEEGKTKNYRMQEQNLLSLSYGRIIRKDINTNGGLLPASFNTYNVVEAGDIIIRPTDLQNDKRSLRTGLVKEQGIITSAYIDLRPKDNVNSKYYHYLLHSYDVIKVFYNMGNGVRQGLNFSEFAKLLLLEPTTVEQQQIADYLDTKCSEIDATAEDIQKEISLLEEYKKSVITEAVTKGLNPDAEMKDSGIEWIGEVPKHWGTIRIGNAFSIRNERNYLPMEQVQLLSLYSGKGVFPTGEEGTTNRGNHAQTVADYKIVKKNDIVVNIILAWMGSLGISNYNGVVSPAYDVYIPNEEKVVPHYYHYVFRTSGIANECYRYGRGIMMMRWRTYSSEFKRIHVPFPPLEEQQQIADFLDSKCSEIDAIIADKKRQLDILADYKKSLIYEYVTGKKEVPVHE